MHQHPNEIWCPGTPQYAINMAWKQLEQDWSWWCAVTQRGSQRVVMALMSSNVRRPVHTHTPTIFQGLVDFLHECLARIFIGHVETQRVAQIRDVIVRLQLRNSCMNDRQFKISGYIASDFPPFHCSRSKRLVFKACHPNWNQALGSDDSTRPDTRCCNINIWVGHFA